jgi:hypothetical protein
MSKCAVADAAADLEARLVDAGADGDHVRRLLAMDDEEALSEFFLRVADTVRWEDFETLSVLDPAVGSGRLLIAAAAEFPRWAVQFGLVQFYGTDIDELCYHMTRANCALLGLNGMGARMMAVTGTLPREPDTDFEKAAELFGRLLDTAEASTPLAPAPPEHPADAQGQLLLF